MTNKRKEIIDTLEMNEPEFLGHLLNQMQDNADGVNRLVSKAQKTNEYKDLAIIAYEVERLSARTESMFNLASDLVKNIDTNIRTARAQLYSEDEND